MGRRGLAKVGWLAGRGAAEGGGTWELFLDVLEASSTKREKESESTADRPTVDHDRRPPARRFGSLLLLHRRHFIEQERSEIDRLSLLPCHCPSC